MQYKSRQTIKRRLSASFVIIVLIWTIGILLSKIPGKSLHIKGELDQAQWTVQDCSSGESYRVIMTSIQALDFERAKKSMLGKSEPIIIEFDGTTIPPKRPWSAHETISINAGSIQLKNGTCRN